MRRVTATIMAAGALSFVGGPPANAVPGALDPSYGQGGMTPAVLPIFDSLALQPDRKLVATAFFRRADGADGDFYLARFRTDGSVDTAFGNAGHVVTDLGGAHDVVSDVVVRPDGRIVVAGTSDGRVTVVRYTTTGRLDRSFSGDGVASTNADPQGEELASQVALTGSGGVLVAGSVIRRDGDFDLLAVRFTASGAPDTTLSGRGWRGVDIAGDFDSGSDVVVTGGGRIVLGGTASVQRQDGSIRRDGALIGLNRDGSRNRSFGTASIAWARLGGANSTVSAVHRQGDGKLVAVGSVLWPDEEGDGAVARFTPGGAPDRTFSQDGRKIVDFAPSSFFHQESITGSALDSRGRLVMTASTEAPYISLARLRPDGSMDRTFGGRGFVEQPFDVTFENFSVGSRALAMQPDDRFLVSTFGDPGGFLARFLPN